MLRGLIGGLISGTAVSGVCLATVSVILSNGDFSARAALNVERAAEQTAQDAPPKAEASALASVAPETAEVEVPAGSQFNQGLEDEAAKLPASEPKAPKEPVVQAQAPEQDSLAALSQVDVASTQAPEIGQIASGLETPEPVLQEGAVALTEDDPIVTQDNARAPEVPQEDDRVQVSTEPAQPLAPAVSDDDVLQAGAETTEAPYEETPQDIATAAPAPTEAEGVTQEVALRETPGDEASGSATAEAAAPAASETPQETALVEVDAEPSLPQINEDTPEEAIEAGVLPDEEDDLLTLTQAETATGDGSSSTIGHIADGIITDGLPRVGDPVETEEAALVPSEDEPVPANDADPVRPIDKFAVAFENAEDKPLMAIVLMDDGQGLVGPEAFTDFPYPVSFAVDVTSPDAKEIAKKYRDAGMEVLAMTNLPENAAAQDVEVAMGVYLEAVPEAVAIMEGLDTGLQSNREAAAQLAPILLASGHGLVMWPNGLNTAQKLAAREGVPSATVFRDFDGQGQGATVIRRFLDQAAFRAGQDEAGVIMVGRLRPDTISALLLWGLQDRASSVALAPVSAVLKASQQ